MSEVNFSDLNRSLLSRVESLLFEWFPEGKTISREFKIGSLNGERGDSLSVNMNTGVWKDFASGEGGADLISLYAAHKGIKQIEAFKALGGEVKSKPKEKPNKVIIYKYDDNLTIKRFEFPTQKKSFAQNHNGTNKKHPNPPVFRCNLTPIDPKKPTLITEGEKSALAAQKLLGQHYNVISWCGGTNAVLKTNWVDYFSRVEKLDVLLWPDCDKPGYKAMAELGAYLLQKRPDLIIAVLDPMSDNLFPENQGWDAHDFLVAKGPDPKNVIEWAKPIKKNMGTISDIVAKAAEDKTPEVKQKITYTLFNPADAGMICKQNGEVVCNANNAEKYIDQLSEWAGKLYFDTFYAEDKIINDDGSVRSITDYDILGVLQILQENRGHTFTEAHVSRAIKMITRKRRASYPERLMESYEWDGVSRIYDFFSTDPSVGVCVCTGDPEYLRQVSQNFWVSMLKKIYDPSAFVKSMVVMVGDQNIMKSMILSDIAGEFFFECPYPNHTRKFVENRIGSFLIELPELQGFIDQSPEVQKNIMSVKQDRHRFPWDRHASTIPRSFIFVGTTNKRTFLDDHTGSSRFWPVKVNSINREYFLENREQFFAEARELMKAGARWHDMPERFMRENNDEFNLAAEGGSGSPWDDIVLNFMDRHPEALRGSFSTVDFLVNYMGIRMGDINKTHKNQAALSIREAGFIQVRRRVGGKRVKIWAWPGVDPERDLIWRQ